MTCRFNFRPSLITALEIPHRSISPFCLPLVILVKYLSRDPVVGQQRVIAAAATTNENVSNFHLIKLSPILIIVQQPCATTNRYRVVKEMMMNFGSIKVGPYRMPLLHRPLCYISIIPSLSCPDSFAFQMYQYLNNILTECINKILTTSLSRTRG